MFSLSWEPVALFPEPVAPQKVCTRVCYLPSGWCALLPITH